MVLLCSYGMDIHLELRDIEFVILFVRTDEFDKNDFGLIMNGYDEPVLIASDIENDFILHNACMGVLFFYIRGTIPRGFFGFVKPRLQGSLTV